MGIYKKSHKSHRSIYQSNTKSQAALEFLTTYAWAFLSILLTLGALYYFGIFDFGKYLPERCIFSSQLECLAFVMNEDNIGIKLVNNLGETITLQSMTITDDSDPALICETIQCKTPLEPLPIIDWNTGDDLDCLFEDCAGGAYINNQRIEAKITLTYFAEATSPPQPIHTVTGKLQGRVK